MLSLHAAMMKQRPPARKAIKYTELSQRYVLMPVAIESHGFYN